MVQRSNRGLISTDLFLKLLDFLIQLPDLIHPQHDDIGAELPNHFVLLVHLLILANELLLVLGHAIFVVIFGGEELVAGAGELSDFLLKSFGFLQILSLLLRQFFISIIDFHLFFLHTALILLQLFVYNKIAYSRIAVFSNFPKPNTPYSEFSETCVRLLPPSCAEHRSSPPLLSAPPKISRSASPKKCKTTHSASIKALILISRIIAIFLPFLLFPAAIA